MKAIREAEWFGDAARRSRSARTATTAYGKAL